MNAHDWTQVYLHWFWVGFFVLFGVFLIARVRNYLSAGSAACAIKMPSDDAAAQRIQAAVKRRADAEGRPVPLGLWLGAFCFFLGALAAFTKVQPALLYALLCLGMAVGVALVFLRIRNSQPTRVAVLSVRSTEAAIPLYWFYLASASALAVLSYTANAQYRFSAIIVTVSSLLTIAIAWRLTNLPALLSGVDIPAEQIVDDRLRSYRSRAVMVFGVVQTFVFCSQVLAEQTDVQTLSYVLTTVVWIAFGIWLIRGRFAPVRLA